MTAESEVEFYTVDAFTDRPFRGNPAAVCVLDAPLEAEAMQTIAAEMNLSETAFVEPPDADGVRPLRWFTPTMEVPLCGHATLASSQVLLQQRGDEPPLRFFTASGLLTVHRDPDGSLRMDFPADPPTIEAPPPGLLECLGCPQGVPCLRAENLWLVRLGAEEDVAELRPNFNALLEVDLGGEDLGVAVTAPGGAPDVDFVSRFFAPWAGIDEDPVTGVAHTVLTPYWADELDRTSLRARQISERGGSLGVRLEGDRVHLVGTAVAVARGRIRVPGS